MGLEDLWGEDEEEPRTVGRNEEGEALRGFAVNLGQTKSRKGKALEVVLRRDAECWMLQIGSRATFHPKLSGVFAALAQFEHVLTAEKTIEDVIAEMQRIEKHVEEVGATLDKKIADFIRKKFPNGH